MVKEVIFGDNTQAEPSIEIDSLSIMIPSAFLVQYLQKFEINNLKLTNFTGSPAVDLAFIQFMLFPNSIFQVRSLEVIQSNFLRSKLILQSEFMNQVIFEDISVKNSLINPSSSLFSLNSIQSIQFSNGIFDGIAVSDPNDISSSIISLEDYTLQNPLNSQILNVEVFTSQVSVFNIEKLSGSALEEQIFEFTNIFVHDMIIPSPRSLIDTSGFVGTGDLKVIMNNLTFVRVIEGLRD